MVRTRMQDQVYFTVRTGGGLADKLSGYFLLRKLGLSLGYTYCHTRLWEARHASQVCGYRLPSWFRKARTNLQEKNLWVSIPMDLYDFLGLNQHFASDKSLPDAGNFPKELRRNIVLSDSLLERNGISSYDMLAQHIKCIVSEEKKPDLPLLLVFERHIPRARYTRILRGIDLGDSVQDAQDAYFHQRKRHPQKSRFVRVRLKVLAHLRLGDRALVCTPSGVWQTGINAEKGLRSWSERDFPHVTTVEFHRFMRGLLRHLPPDIADVQIYSDGFERTKRMVERNRATFSLTLPEIRLWNKGLRDQQRSLVRLFKTLPNSTYFIGERRSYFHRLIHAATEADLFISAFPIQQNTLTALAKWYRTRNSMPTILLLHKPNSRLAKIFSEKASRVRARFQRDEKLSANIIFVDIDAPDFPGLAQQIMARYKLAGTACRD